MDMKYLSRHTQKNGLPQPQVDLVIGMPKYDRGAIEFPSCSRRSYDGYYKYHRVRPFYCRRGNYTKDIR